MNYQNLEAGREMDALIYEKVLGMDLSKVQKHKRG